MWTFVRLCFWRSLFAQSLIAELVGFCLWLFRVPPLARRQSRSVAFASQLAHVSSRHLQCLSS